MVIAPITFSSLVWSRHLPYSTLNIGVMWGCAIWHSRINFLLEENALDWGQFFTLIPGYFISGCNVHFILPTCFPLAIAQLPWPHSCYLWSCRTWFLELQIYAECMKIYLYILMGLFWSPHLFIDSMKLLIDSVYNAPFVGLAINSHTSEDILYVMEQPFNNYSSFCPCLLLFGFVDDIIKGQQHESDFISFYLCLFLFGYLLSSISYLLSLISLSSYLWLISYWRISGPYPIGW